MADLSVFLPFIMPHALNALEPTVHQKLRETAVDFCRSTRCWRERVAVSITENDEPIVAVPGGANLFELDVAMMEGRELQPIPYSEVEWDRDPGMASYISTMAGNRFMVSPPEAGLLRLSLFLEPSVDCDELPDFLFHDHHQALADGTIAKLLLLPNQPYTDPGKAAMHQALYQAQADRNFASNVRGKQRAKLRSKCRYF